MILVDTSIIINHFKKTKNQESNHKGSILRAIISQELPYGIASFTYQEILQGARSEKEFAQMRERLDMVPMYYLPAFPKIFEEGAHIYCDLRRKGITLRGPTDILIALTAICHDFPLLHNDRDFDHIASVAPNLRIMRSVNDLTGKDFQGKNNRT
jgi:predicted nucleic acid-binding protein